MAIRKIWGRVIPEIANFVIAALGGDRRKILILVILILLGFLIFWVESVLFRREARRYGWPLDGSVPQDNWVPPSAKAANDVLNSK